MVTLQLKPADFTSFSFDINQHKQTTEPFFFLLVFIYSDPSHKKKKRKKRMVCNLSISKKLLKVIP